MTNTTMTTSNEHNNALEEAEQAKTELRSMVVEALRAKGGK